MLVTQQGLMSVDEYVGYVKQCVLAGVSAVQLREKHLSFTQLATLGHALQEMLKTLDVPLIINDNLALCVALDAAGLHLGQDDGCVVTARQRLGDKKIIGLSVNSFEQLHHACSLPVDYIGIGAIFNTSSKPDVQTIWGVDKLAEAARYATKPLVAIGGINQHNIGRVLQANVAGIAAISALHSASSADITLMLNQINQGLLCSRPSNIRTA